MNNIIYSLNDIIKICANTYGHTNSCDKTKLSHLVKTQIDKYSDMNNIFEYLFADIDTTGISIANKYRDIFCINRFKSSSVYNSTDPTFKVETSNDLYYISYIYNDKKYNSICYDSYNIEIFSNYAFFHDVLFSYILEKY
jgi:hypothetical protein